MTYHPVTPPARWRRRRIRQVLGVVAMLGLWLGGAGWCVHVQLRDHPEPTWQRWVEATVLYAVLWGAALRQPWRRTR